MTKHDTKLKIAVKGNHITGKLLVLDNGKTETIQLNPMSESQMEKVVTQYYNTAIRNRIELRGFHVPD